VNDTAAASLFDEVVEASGLSPVIAPFTISRLLLRAGVRTELDADGLARALDEIERGLGVYLPAEEVAAAMGRIGALARA
jgi:hypothetical protein